MTPVGAASLHGVPKRGVPGLAPPTRARAVAVFLCAQLLCGAALAADLDAPPGPRLALQGLCPSNCSNHGVCRYGRCACADGYSGDSCQLERGGTCKESCSKHGVCRSGRCYCQLGFTGPTCELSAPLCANNCSKHGVCNSGRCACNPGFSGEACQVVTPPATRR